VQKVGEKSEKYPKKTRRVPLINGKVFLYFSLFSPTFCTFYYGLLFSTYETCPCGLRDEFTACCVLSLEIYAFLISAISSPCMTSSGLNFLCSNSPENWSFFHGVFSRHFARSRPNDSVRLMQYMYVM
jgi:hypothetical protein